MLCNFGCQLAPCAASIVPSFLAFPREEGSKLSRTSIEEPRVRRDLALLNSAAAEQDSRVRPPELAYAIVCEPQTGFMKGEMRLGGDERIPRRMVVT